MAPHTACELHCKFFDDKLLHTNPNNTPPTGFAKKYREDIITLPHKLCSLKFPYFLVLVLLIKKAFSTGVQMLFGLHYF